MDTSYLQPDPIHCDTGNAPPSQVGSGGEVDSSSMSFGRGVCLIWENCTFVHLCSTDLMKEISLIEGTGKSPIMPHLPTWKGRQWWLHNIIMWTKVPFGMCTLYGLLTTMIFKQLLFHNVYCCISQVCHAEADPWGVGWYPIGLSKREPRMFIASLERSYSNAAHTLSLFKHKALKLQTVL